MPAFTIRLADINISVVSVYASAEKFCKNYITDSPAEIFVQTAESDIIKERERSLREAALEGHETREFPPAYLETLALYRKIVEVLIDRGVLLFHGSAVEIDGKAYIFTAKSGTGKSTHAALLQKEFGDRVRIINDDKPLIKLTDGGAVVYGTPWNGKHHRGANTSAPLKAICILERGEKNSIEKCEKMAFVGEIFSQIYRPSEAFLMKRTLELAGELLSLASIYRLRCNMESEAARISFFGMVSEK